MKLHLPVRLFKLILSCLIPVTCLTVGSGVVMAEEQASIILGEQEKLTIDYADADTLQDVGGILQLLGGTQLDLSNCGDGDGRTYTLLTGVSALLDAEGNAIVLDSSNNAISHYFDTTRPGTGFWAGGWLQLAPDGTVQLVLHGEEVREALTITTRQTGSKTYNYYEGVCFRDITYTPVGSSVVEGGAIYGGPITLSNNGSVTFSGNTASGSIGSSPYSPPYVRGGAISGGTNGGTITLSNNGSVTFSGNTASSSKDKTGGGAIHGVTITLSNNGSVTFSGNTASGSAAYGGAIYGVGTITLNNNGSVVFSGNSASGSGGAYGGAIYGGTITLSNNESVTFSGNMASGSGGAIYGGDNSTITLNNNGSVTFSGNEASSSSYRGVYGGAIDGGGNHHAEQQRQRGV